MVDFNLTFNGAYVLLDDYQVSLIPHAHVYLVSLSCTYLTFHFSTTRAFPQANLGAGSRLLISRIYLHPGPSMAIMHLV